MREKLDEAYIVIARDVRGHINVEIAQGIKEAICHQTAMLMDSRDYEYVWDVACTRERLNEIIGTIKESGKSRIFNGETEATIIWLPEYKKQ